MDLLAYLAAILHNGYIAGYYGTYTCLVGCINNLTHKRNIFLVDDGINSKITLQSVFMTRCGNLLQVGHCERVSRMSTHIQLLNAEVNTISSSLYSRHETLARTDRRHNFKIVKIIFHDAKLQNNSYL